MPFAIEVEQEEDGRWLTKFQHCPACSFMDGRAKGLLQGHRSWRSESWRTVWSTTNLYLKWVRSLRWW